MHAYQICKPQLKKKYEKKIPLRQSWWTGSIKSALGSKVTSFPVLGLPVLESLRVSHNLFERLKFCYAGALSETNPSSLPLCIFLLLLIQILGLTFLTHFMFLLPELPPFNPPFSYQFVIYGAASLRKWSLYHLLAHLRLPCCSYHHSLSDVHFLPVFLPCSVYTRS